MKGVEFYTFKGDVFISTASGEIKKLREEDHEMVNDIINDIETIFVPDTFKALQERYAKSRSNRPFYLFLMARGFCKCNFGVIDSKLDIDNQGDWHLEDVPCPLRGECIYEGRICHPTKDSNLRPSELQVIECLYKGMSRQEAAELNNISICTCNKHIQNARERHNFRDLADLFKYCAENKLFNDE